MVSREQLETVRELVDEASRRRRLAAPRGPVDPPAGLEAVSFYARTVLTGATDEMRIMREEIFGPCFRSSWSNLRIRRSHWPTTASSAWARRSGQRTAARGSESHASSSRGWSGPTTTCSATARASARGAQSRSPDSTHALQVLPVRVREHQAARVGALEGRQCLVAPVGQDAGQGAASDGHHPLRPTVDPRLGDPRRARGAPQGRRAAGPRRPQALARAGRPRARAVPRVLRSRTLHIVLCTSALLVVVKNLLTSVDDCVYRSVLS
jgi:hypothetical protein